MKKQQLKSLKINKVAIAKFNVFGGRAPESNGCNDAQAPPPDDDFVWFTDAYERLCETFDGTGCF